MAPVTTAVIGPAVKEKFNRILLKRVQPYLTAHYFAYLQSMPMNSGNAMVFRRYGTLQAATTPLTEGAPGTETPVNVTDIKVEIKQYGAFQKVSDWSQYTTQENVLNELGFSFSQMMGITLDALYFNVLNSSASVMYASGGVTTPSTSSIGFVTEKDVRTAVSLLKGANARMLSTRIAGRDAYNTFPVRPAYWGLGHTDIVTYDLQKIALFISATNYPNDASVLGGMEEGAVLNTRWVGSTQAIKITTGSLTSGSGASTATTSDPHYALCVTGDQAYGGVKLGRDMGQLIFKELGSSGVFDPLNQWASIGWKMSWGGSILNDKHLLRIICRDSRNFVAVP